MASASGPGGTWQKKLTLMGASVAARMAPSSSAMASGESMAQGSAPRPPALATAMASSLPWAPAMGAWRIGSAMPRVWIRLIGVLPDLVERRVKRRALRHDARAVGAPGYRPRRRHALRGDAARRRWYRDGSGAPFHR